MSLEGAKEIMMAGGKVSSSEIPRLELIATEFLIRTAKRCELGIERKGFEKAWNALSPNQEVLLDKEFILARLGHIVLHANQLRDKIQNGEDLLKEDDAGAIAWGAMCACCATKVMSEKGEK